MVSEIKEGRWKETDDQENEKALQEILKILSDHPEVAERITITIRPRKIKQGTDKPKK